MIHHVSVGTNDVESARKFYDPVMKALGFRRMKQSDRDLDYGVGAIIFSVTKPLNGQPATPGNGSHIAFTVDDRAMVEEFYRLALENGGSEDGAPGPRPEYDDNYFGAFVFDPDGNKIEAVTYSAK
jgi:catechol 2,3-dioxygenase-like lactoylglutathione lyase family enzyme